MSGPSLPSHLAAARNGIARGAGFAGSGVLIDKAVVRAEIEALITAFQN